MAAQNGPRTAIFQQNGMLTPMDFLRRIGLQKKSKKLISGNDTSVAVRIQASRRRTTAIGPD